MLTQTQLSALHRSHRGERVLTAYVDGSAPDPAAQRTWRLHLDRAIKDIRSWLDDSPRDERDDFEHCLGLLEERIAAFDPTVKAPGWVAFITRTGVVDAQPVPVSVPTRLIWSNGPCLAPCLRVLGESQPVVIAVADAKESKLYKYEFGTLELVDRVRSHHAMEPPSHMGDAPRQGFHGGTRGTTGTDAAQREHDDARDRMLADAAERAANIAGSTGWLVLGGIPSVAARLEENLSAARGRVLRLDHLDVHASDAVIRDAARGGAATLREARELELVQTVADRAAANGLGTVGADATRNALAAESVHHLIVTRRYLEDHAPEAESAVGNAFDQAALVEEVSGRAAELLDDHGGIGAALRFHAPQISPPSTPPAERAESRAERPERQRRSRSKSTQ